MDFAKSPSYLFAAMMTRIFFLLSMLWQGLLLPGQIVISGKWINRPADAKSITYFEPVSAGEVNVYLNPRQARLDSHNEFRITGARAAPEYIALHVPGCFVEIPALDADSLHLSLYGRMGAGAPLVDSIVFSGAHARAYSAYYKAMTIISNQNYLLSAVFAVRHASLDAFVEYTFGFIDSLVAPLDSTAPDNSPRGFYSILEKDIMATCLTNVFNLYGLLSGQSVLPDTRPSRYNAAIRSNGPLFSWKEFEAFRSAVYLKFDPLDSLLIHSSLGIFYSYFYAKDLFDQLFTAPVRFDS